MPPSRRMSRVNQLLKEEIADVLRTEVTDEALTDALISITEVDTSPDLRSAKVYFSVYGDDEQVQAVQKHLDRAAGFLRHHLLDRLDLRAVPRLEFLFDGSIAQGDRIMQLMRGIERERSADDEG